MERTACLSQSIEKEELFPSIRAELRISTEGKTSPKLKEANDDAIMEHIDTILYL